MPDERENTVRETKPSAPKPVSVELPSRATNPVSMTSAAISPPKANTKTAKIDNDLVREVELLARKKLQAEEDSRAGVKRLTEAQRAEAERRRQIQLMAILAFAIVAAVLLIILTSFEKSRTDRQAMKVPQIPVQNRAASGFGTQTGTFGANGRPAAVGYYPAVSPYSQGTVRQTFPVTGAPLQPQLQQRVPVNQVPPQAPTPAYPAQPQPDYPAPPVQQQGYPYSPSNQQAPPPAQMPSAAQPTQVQPQVPVQQPAAVPQPAPVQPAPDQQVAPQAPQNNGDQSSGDNGQSGN